MSHYHTPPFSHTELLLNPRIHHLGIHWIIYYFIRWIQTEIGKTVKSNIHQYASIQLST